MLANLLRKNGFIFNDLTERVHIIINLIDNLCHEIVYHQHSTINYDLMNEIVVNQIVNILTEQD